ncbi:TPA: fructokinase [Providencia stuartii]|uniref:fructokinase n=1 Tax=Providencia stuartii TaxID=588 RepID=UPI00123C04F4|nr:fructokinase [Providencia stuartii]QET99677.1 fructokinase [Providencia stuartii]HEM6915867.1 fructokinase [Providencia stuartii]HEM7167755.1 fructokinase [Providencia stuartii]HEM8143298.1 fructokinase [Providencia stuartii]HEM8874277.1 fructokinase [Providencia stuartii]
MRIGIDLGGTKIEVIALDDNGETLFRKRVATPKGDYNATLNAIAGLVHDAEVATARKGSVGVGIPGTLSPVTGKVKNANSTWLNGQFFDVDLARILERPVKVANDANCLAVSEAVDGAGKGAKVVFAVIIGTGCGAGIAINGQVHSGGNGVAGEWGHNPLPWQDSQDALFLQEEQCYCGLTGCTELFVSGTGFMADYRKLSGETKIGSEIIELMKSGDPHAIAAMTHYQSRLARALAQVINMLDPDVIVLGGGMSNVEGLYQTLPSLVKNWVFGRECDTPIRQAIHGDSSGVRGAAWLWPK